MPDTHEPDSVAPGTRPRLVTIAYALWLIAAVDLLLVALLSINPALTTDAGRVFVRALGALCLLVGLAVGYLAGKVRAGSVPHRRALVTLSLVYGVMLLVGVLFVGLGPLLLVAAVLLIAPAVAVYRPAAELWFDRA